ncbi:MAG: hypothetical protein SGCHY_004949, partial [Lobulomycetales sp.]
AIKRKLLSKRLQESIQREISILRQTSHPNITRLYSVSTTPDYFYLLLEYCQTDLNRYLKSHVLPIGVALNFYAQLRNALRFLHKNKIIHRDLKPSNVLLKDEKYLKLADFGFARTLLVNDMASTICGSPLYMAPEILRGDNYDAKADLWSIGAVFYEILFNSPPFKARNHIELLKKIDQTNAISFPSADSRTDSDHSTRPIPIIRRGSNSGDRNHGFALDQQNLNDMKDLIQGLLRRNPMERISFQDFFAHPCFMKHAHATPIDSPQSLKFNSASPLPRTPLFPMMLERSVSLSSQESLDGPRRAANPNNHTSSPVDSPDLHGDDAVSFVIRGDAPHGGAGFGSSLKVNNSLKSASIASKKSSGAGSVKSNASSGSQSIKIPVAGPTGGILMIEPPFPGYDVDPDIFSDLIRDFKGADPAQNLSPQDPVFDPTRLETLALQPDASGSSSGFKSSEEFVKISANDHHIRQPPFLTTLQGHIFEPSMLSEIGLPLPAIGNELDPMLHLIAVRAFAVQTLADNLRLVNLYLTALGLYKLGIDISAARPCRDAPEASSAELEREETHTRLVAFIQRNFEYCVEQGNMLCNGQEETEAAAENVIYSRALELAQSAGENELAGHSYAACQIAYEQGIVLLEALLDAPAAISSDETREVVEKLVKGLYTRLEVIKEKQE